MENKILKTYTLENLEEVINQYIENEILKKGKVDLLEKWNYFSLVALEKDDVVNKFLEGCKYIDDFSLEKSEKIALMLTLSYLTVKEKMPINSIGLIYHKKTINSIAKEFVELVVRES